MVIYRLFDTSMHITMGWENSPDHGIFKIIFPIKPISTLTGNPS